MECLLQVAEFLVSFEDTLIELPQAEEKLRISESLRELTGFPGAFGALGAMLVDIAAPTDAEDRNNYQVSAIHL